MQRALSITTGMALVVVGLTCAQAQSDVIEEIVVTATKRSENLSDISGSVTALAGEDLALLGIDDLFGIASNSPGVMLHQPLRNRSVFTIRGINTDIGETQLTQEPVALYINDVPATIPFGELVQPDLALYDIERVEVLRGPQGTLFGSGSLGGVVRVLTRAPQLDDFAASFRLDYGNVSGGGSRQRADAMVNVPLVEDRLALRAVAYAREEAGWVDNVTLGIDNGGSNHGGRVALLYQPRDDLSFKLEALYQDSDPDDADSWNPQLDQFVRSTLISEARPAELGLYNLTVDWDVTPGLHFLSSTSFKRVETSWVQDLGAIPGIGPLLNRSPFFDTDAVVQEIRLSSVDNDAWNWVAGLYYVEAETDSLLSFDVIGLQDFVQAILGPQAQTAGALIRSQAFVTSQERAVFGDVSRQWSPAWRTSLGLRFFETETVFDQAPSVAFNFATLSDLALPPFVNRNSDSDWTWRAILAWEPDEASHYYLNLSRGFRVGQVNPAFGPSFVDPTDVVISPVYEADESFNVELGAKLRLMEGRLALEAALYSIDWQDVQVDARRPSDQRNFIANAGDARSEGLELRLAAVVAEGFDLDLSATWLDAEVDAISAQNTFLSGAQVGDTLPGAADFVASAGAVYQWPAAQGRQWRLQANARYTGDSPNRFSLEPATGQPNPDFAINASYTAINASLALLDERWGVTLYAENLTDNDSIILNIGASLPNPAVSLAPRTIGLRFDYRL